MIGTSRVTLNNGVEMPWVGFGVFQVPPGQKTYDAVRTALRVGYRAVDTAAAYNNEADVGRALREAEIDRDELFITTKLWIPDHGYDNTLRAFDASRKKLGLDTVDLYLVHWPANKDFTDTWKAMERLHREGQVRAIGVSNFLTTIWKPCSPARRSLPR